MRQIWGWPVLAATLCVYLAARASAQTCAPGELRVFVEDSQQAPVFDALVRVGADVSPFGRRLTQSTGVAAFENVPCGSLLVTASKDGFETAGKTVQIGGQSRVDVTLVLNPKMQVSSVDVTESAPPVEQTASYTTELHPSEVKTLPTNPATVAETLPLVPVVTRSPTGELTIDGSGEQRSAMVVNQTDVTDPATGKFGQTIPVDSVETVNVLNTPFLAQYGRFTAGVVAVETRRGGEKWHADLNDPFPDFRIRSWHMRGIRNETPRGVLGGPLIRERLYLNTALQYFFERDSSRTLPFPYNESKRQWVNSFTQLDLILSPKQIVTATLHVSPQHANFVNLDYFNPQPSAPSYAQQTFVGTLADHFGLFGGILDGSLSFQRFNATVGAQGGQDMILTPVGNRGNYFGTQNRAARRTEWLETWSPVPVRLAGTHLVKLGTSLTGSGDDGQFTYRPVEIVNTAEQTLERIDFSRRNPFSRADLEFTVFAQDHWVVTPRISFDYGARVEHQRLPSSFRIAPRGGFAWTPFPNGRTVFRAGYGQFYDHVPLDVYTFGRYPERTVTYYAPDGSPLGEPTHFVNVIGSVTGPRSFLIRGKMVAGAFSPRGATWNAQAEHSFSKLLRLRGVYTDSRSVGLIVLEPDLLGTTREIVLNGDGSSRYRQAEFTAGFNWKDAQRMVISYTRSRAEGSLNAFDTYLGNFPAALVRPDVYSNLPGDLPNRFLLWGRVKVPRLSLEVLPLVEYRNGFPYAQLDALQNYVGTPNRNSTRFPDFFSADARIVKDFKATLKYTVRLSLSAFNLSDHFNPLAVHANTADPLQGVFFGNYHRRYRGDFEILF